MVVARVRSWGVRGVVKRRARLHVINIIYLTNIYVYIFGVGGGAHGVCQPIHASGRPGPGGAAAYVLLPLLLPSPGWVVGRGGGVGRATHV